MLLRAEPLSAEAFAPFGEVIDETVGGSPTLEINEGFVTRHHALAAVDCDGPAVLSIFSARRRPLSIGMLERHPFGSQAFVPLGGGEWLVVVAADPVPKACRAFRCAGGQGVSYRRGVWHHPLLILDARQSFLVVDRADTASNLEEVSFRSAIGIVA